MKRFLTEKIKIDEEIISVLEKQSVYDESLN